MKTVRISSRHAGLSIAAVGLLAGLVAPLANESPGIAAVLPPGVGVDFRAAQRELAQRQPASRIARANIAIRQDHVELLDPASGASLVILQQAPAPPWFAPTAGHPLDADTQLLLHYLAGRQNGSPWQASTSVAKRADRDDWAGQPVRNSWQLWLAGSVIWMALIAIGWNALRPLRK